MLLAITELSIKFVGVKIKKCVSPGTKVLLLRFRIGVDKH